MVKKADQVLSYVTKLSVCCKPMMVDQPCKVKAYIDRVMCRTLLNSPQECR